MNGKPNVIATQLKSGNVLEFAEHGLAVSREIKGRGLGYGDSPMELLAKEAFRGITRANVHLRALRFYRRFSHAEVVRAHRLGMPLRCFDSLMPYYPSESELKQAREDRVLAARIAQRKKKAKEFMNLFGRGKLRGAAFRREVISWHKNHMHLFSPGKTNKLAIESVGRLRQHAVELMGEATECDAILAANGRAGSATARRRLRQLIKALKKTSSIAC